MKVKIPGKIADLIPVSFKFWRLLVIAKEGKGPCCFWLQLWRAGSGNKAKYGPHFWLLSPLEAPKWVQDPGNGLKSIRGSWGDHLGSISGSWTHLGASWGLRSQKWGPYLAIFGPSLTPPANLVKFFWSKMACTGVPHIVLHVSCRTRTSGGYFWPSEVRFRGILAHFDRLIL